MMIYSKRLTKAAFLLAFLAVSVRAQADQVTVEHALGQLNVMNAIIDTIGQNLASGASQLSTTRKFSVQKSLKDVREGIENIKRFTAVHITEKEEYKLAQFNTEIINFLDKALASNLQAIPLFNFDALLQLTLPSDDEITQKTAAILKANDKRLIALIKNSESIGLSGFNKTYRSVRKFAKEFHIASVIEHAAVYSALVVWWMYVTAKGDIEAVLQKDASKRNFMEKFVAAGKTWTGSEPKRLDGSVDLPVVVDLKNQVPLKAEVFIDSAKNIIQGAKFVSPDTKQSENTQQGTATVPMSLSTNDHSIYNTLAPVFKAILTIDNSAPVFTIAPGVLFAEYIKKDAAKAYEFALKLKHRFDDYFFGTTKKNTYEDLTIRTERFSDIVGREDVKAELQRVVEYICNPDRFDRAGIKVERGYLLAGEPQTGKTLMAKALAGEISAALKKQGKTQEVRLFEICTDRLAKHGIAYYMELAKSQAPCILFLDELDLLRLQRDGDTKTLSEFLTSMSGSLNSNEKDHVIILAATNKPENIDFALRQHGRFGKMFWFDKPTFKHRVEFFIKEFEKRCTNTNAFNFETLAQQTENCSFGTLDIVMKKALMLAKLENNPVTQAHVEAAINFEVRKLIPHGYTVSADKEEFVASRQAGKALVSILLNPAKTLCTVTVLPITQDLEEEHVTQQYNIPGMRKNEQRAVRLGGIFAYHLGDALDITTQDELIKQCKISLAGNVAQRVYGLASCAFDKADKQEAFTLVKRVIFEGLDSKEMAKEIREEKLTAAYRLLEKYEAEVEELLKEHKKELSAIVELLQKHKTLSVGQIKEAINK